MRLPLRIPDVIPDIKPKVLPDYSAVPGSIAGYCYYYDGINPQSSVEVSDGTRSATSNAAGYYKISSIPPGTYTLTPHYGTETFTPATRVVVVAFGQNVTGKNFIGSYGTP